MKKFKHVLAYLAIWSLYCSNIVWADDTDIYLNASSSGGKPYLMLTMDYFSNLSSTACRAGTGNNSCVDLLQNEPELLAELQAIAGVEQKATNMEAMIAVLKTVFDKFEGIYVGLMINNEDDGGTVLRGFEEFLENDTNSAKSGLINILKSLPAETSDNYHTAQPKETHFEFYKYLNGGAVFNGFSTSANFGGTNTPAPDVNVRVDGAGATAPYVYETPFSGDPADFECTKIYEVYATTGNENSDSGLDAYISAEMSGVETFEEMLTYMSTEDILTSIPGEQNLKTWFISLGGNVPSAEGWAEAAGTDSQFMEIDSLIDIKTTLESVFIEALSVSTTFVAASVPVNVFNRLQTLDNFYIAIFEAESNTRWPGNIKKLKMVDTDDDGNFDDIQDALGNTAFSNEDGRIRYEALTFWTNSGQLPDADPDENEIDGLDGRAVERGGAGQKIPGFISGSIGDDSSSTTRQLYYETSPGALTAFNADNNTANSLQAALGASSRNDALEIIRWARGQDTEDEDGDNNRTEARPWVLGDAIHSRPLAINYGATSSYSEENPNIRLFMGTNDGIFHVFENTDTSGNESGKEVMGFIPSELMSNFILLKNNITTDHDYGIDGEPVALVSDLDSDGTIESADGEEVYIYFGMRRGGKSYYILDASDPSSNPTFVKKITQTIGGNFDELGFTFSKPKIGKVRYGGADVDVMIFAGGYDMNKDGTLVDADGARGSDSMGNAVYIINARTGDLIWKVTAGGTAGGQNNSLYHHPYMRFGIPSEIAPLDANRNGIIDRLYVGDMGGLVWRIDLPEGNSSEDGDHRLNNWEANVLAVLSDTPEADDRRFFHAPDVVQTSDSTGDYDAVIIASGDRANPLETTDNNKVYVLKDRAITSGSPGSTIAASSLTDVDSCSDPCNVTNGWFKDLSSTGEKGLSSPLVANGDIYFTSYVPASSGGSCAPAEGSGNLYVLNLSDGDESFANSAGMDIGPGIPSPVIALSGGTILVPGLGIQDVNNPNQYNRLVDIDGQSVWKLYWRSTGKDKL